MPWTYVIGAVVGSLISSEATQSAADTQADAARAASSGTMDAAAQARADVAPWREAGGSAVNRLSYLLGLNPGAEASRAAALQRQDRTFYENLLRPNFTTTSTGYPVNEFSPATSDTRVDEAGLRAAVDRIMASQPRVQGTLPVSSQIVGEGSIGRDTVAGQAGQLGGQGGDFGSLNRQFSYQDFLNDPVTKASFDFGLQEGRKALGSQLAASGLSGGGTALKALTRYGTDYAGQRANESFNRFNVNQTNTYNRLSNLAGLGQLSAQQTANIGVQSGRDLANIGIGNANAQGAARIAQGNIWGNTLSGLGNWWSQQQMVNSLNQNPYGGGSNYYTPNYGYGPYGDWAAPG